MQTHLAEAAGTWDSSQGAFISSAHQRLAEILADYNPHFSLVWIPPKDRSAEDTKPFAILDSSPGRAAYIVRYLSDSEMKDPATVLAWVFEGDLSKHKPVDVLQRMELREQARQLLELKEQEDRLAEEQDKLDFIARTPLNKFKIGDTVYSDY
jgi:hypothetical protein